MENMAKMKVALAFSGGLDTSVCLKLLQEKYNADVITVTVDVGQGSERLETAAKKSERLGAIKHHSIDAREEFIGHVFKSIKANGLYEGYPLSTALARYPTASELVGAALKERADAAAHGCTGKGNDQFRFDMTISVKAPGLRIIAPIRELNLDRKWEIRYAREHGIPVDVDKPYSIDENLWGRSIEGSVLEDPARAPPEDIYKLTRSPARAPAKPRLVRIGFKGGVPVALDGKRIGGIALVSELNELAGAHGVGRIDMIEDRVLGLKAREIYEAPAANLLLEAHQALERLILTRDELAFKSQVDGKWAELVYRGLWFDPLRDDLDTFIEATQRHVEGEVEIELGRGYSRVVGRKSPYSIYDKELVSFETPGFDQREVGALMKFHGLEGKISRERRAPREEG